MIANATFDAETLGDLFLRCGEIHRAGSTILHAADPSTELYVLLDGKVEFWVRTAGGRRVLGTAGNGTVFGEVACFAGGKRSASVSAAIDCAVLRLSRAAALELVERSPAFALQIVRTLGERLYALTRPPTAAGRPPSIDNILAGSCSARAA